MHIPLVPVVSAAVLCFVLGFLIHGPLFGKLWARLAHMTYESKPSFASMARPMFLNFLGNLVAAYILSAAIGIASVSGIMGELTWYKGAIIGAWLWLGFVVVWTSMDVLWMKKSFKLWLFNIASALVNIAAMGALLGAWR